MNTVLSTVLATVVARGKQSSFYYRSEKGVVANDVTLDGGVGHP
jgi:hypothetical protein